MRRHSISIALGLTICCLLSCRSVALRPDPLATVSSFTAAFNNLDADALRRLFADDASAFLPFAATGARLNGREAIVHAIEPLFAAERARASHGAPFLNLTAKETSVQRLGDDAAVVSFDVGTPQVHSRRTLVLRFKSGRWLIVHLHASNVRPEPG